MTKRILAWHGDPELKAATILRMKQHAVEDRFIRGWYVRQERGEWTGCFHGCLSAERLAAEMGIPPTQLEDGAELLQPRWHEETERFFGIPAHVGLALDGIYESTDEPAAEVATQILEAIPVGADLSNVRLEKRVAGTGPGHGEWEWKTLPEVLRALRRAPVIRRELIS